MEVVSASCEVICITWVPNAHGLERREQLLRRILIGVRPRLPHGRGPRPCSGARSRHPEVSRLASAVASSTDASTANPGAPAGVDAGDDPRRPILHGKAATPTFGLRRERRLRRQANHMNLFPEPREVTDVGGDDGVNAVDEHGGYHVCVVDLLACALDRVE